MSLPLLDAYPDPLAPEIRPLARDDAAQEAAIAGLIDRAMNGPPLPGTVGRLELLRHWEGLSSDQRARLLLFAREISDGTRPGTERH